jgi:sulfur carrier protein
VIQLNGQDCEVRPQETLAALVRRLELGLDARGVAVAVDGEVIPRRVWESCVLGDGARVEVVTAMQGG